MLLNVNEYWIIDPENKTLEIVNFQNKKEVRKEIVTSGIVNPRVKGFESFNLQVETLFSNSQN